jgi:hypothetical protein
MNWEGNMGQYTTWNIRDVQGLHTLELKHCNMGWAETEKGMKG